MTREEKRAVLLDWLAWALAARIDRDFMLRGSVPFVMAKLAALNS